MDWITIQFQDLSGNWRMITQTQNIPAMITSQMRSVQSNYPNSRVRAVDSSGRIVDML